jgi:hypothetical protein
VTTILLKFEGGRCLESMGLIVSAIGVLGTWISVNWGVLVLYRYGVMCLGFLKLILIVQGLGFYEFRRIL